LFGDVTVKRNRYNQRRQASQFPLDGELNLAADQYSDGVRKRVAKEAIRGSYDDAVQTIRDTTGCSIARRQSQNVVKDIVQDFEDYYQQNELSKREETQDILVLTCDGKCIVMRPNGLRECTRKDSLMTISQTAKKLGVNTYEYILDRVSCEFKLPSLAELIQKKANRIARQVLSLHNEKQRYHF
jgi:hypothetical protein